ncbi:MAG: tRNA (adenosine(37)-N6)-dimethylallyltransferase MiaA [Parcubacteria group bacterium]|nr:tRNA (adenosine(37)-N6)-dimethylallyltransferase MiaA [Parcubacteria group bacterium]
MISKLVAIVGPTASGKTVLGIELAKRFNSIVISADSRLVYRGMDIGTDKPKGEWRTTNEFMSGAPVYKNVFTNAKLYTIIDQFHCGGVFIVSTQPALGGPSPLSIPHFMIDVVRPDESFSVAEYHKIVTALLTVLPSEVPPLLVGGTGLYIQSVVEGLTIPKVPPQSTLRGELSQWTNEELLLELEKYDPETARVIDPHNKRRLIRALEVIRTTNLPFSAQKTKEEPPFEVLQIGLSLPREELYRRIDARVDQEIKDGLIEETKNLALRYGWDIPSMSGLGYRQIGQYLRGGLTLAHAIERLKYATHAYARRQLTWFRKNKKIEWFDDTHALVPRVAEFLESN